MFELKSWDGPAGASCDYTFAKRLSICRCIAARCSAKADFTHPNRKVCRAINFYKRNSTIGENKREVVFERASNGYLIVWRQHRCLPHIGIYQGILIAVSKVTFPLPCEERSFVAHLDRFCVCYYGCGEFQALQGCYLHRAKSSFRGVCQRCFGPQDAGKGYGDFQLHQSHASTSHGRTSIAPYCGVRQWCSAVCVHRLH